MKFLVSLHDTVLLWCVQEASLAHPNVSIFVTLVVTIFLPRHRRAVRWATWMLACWWALCLIVYRGGTAAPILTLVVAGAYGYRLTIWSFWRLPAGVKGQPDAGNWSRIRLRLAWCMPLIREYLRVDPRCVFWFDMARAARGLPIHRTREQRREQLEVDPYLQNWRRSLWQLAMWVVEARIWAMQHLGRWWQRPFMSTRLDEPQLLAMLTDECAIAESEMNDAWTGKSFEEYCERTTEDRLHTAKRGAWYARKTLLLRRAEAEFLAFGEPWSPGSADLMFAATALYRAWVHERTHHRLWETATLVEVDSEGESEGDLEATSSSAAESAERPSAEDSKATAAESLPKVPDILVAQDTPPINGGPSTISDADLFAPATSQSLEVLPADEAGSQAVPEPKWSESDLATGSSILEAMLNANLLPLAGRVKHCLELLKAREPSDDRSFAPCMLLMFYCLREDLMGTPFDQLRERVLQQLRGRFGKETTYSRWFWEMYFLVRMERRQFTDVIYRIGHRDDLDPDGWRLLGEVKLAAAATDRGKFDIYGSQAIRHFFRAGFRGLWTLEYASQLFAEVSSTEDLRRLINEYSVRVEDFVFWEVVMSQSGRDEDLRFSVPEALSMGSEFALLKIDGGRPVLESFEGMPFSINDGVQMFRAEIHEGDRISIARTVLTVKEIRSK